MALVAFQFLIGIASIVVVLLALAGAVVCINFAWNLFKSVLNIKE